MRLHQVIAFTLPLLAVTFLPGCGQKKVVVSSFFVTIGKSSAGLPTLTIQHREPSLQSCKVAINVLFEDGNTQTYNRVWEFWEDPKTIELPKGAKVERVEIAGTAFRVVKGQGQAVELAYVERFR